MPITVAEFIEELKKMPQDSILVMQKDSEGNGYSPLAGADDKAVYQEETTWSGYVYDTEWSADDAGMDEEEWEEFKKENPPCVVLYPVN